jgi:hypothetical protein
METKFLKLYFVAFILVFSSCRQANTKPIVNDYKFVVTIELSAEYEYLRSTIENTIFFTDPESNSHKWNNVSTNWNYSWTQTDEKYILISAVNNSQIGDIKITLYKNGQEVKTNTGFNGATSSIIGFY